MSLCLVDIHGDIEGDYDILHNFPRNATNGDILKAIFPNIEIVDDFEYSIGVRLNNSSYVQFYKDWWNAPYKGDKE